MAQGSDPNWLNSPFVQIGIAIGSMVAGIYFAYNTIKKLFGNGNGDNSTEKTRLALDALSKVNDAQARLIEYYQEHEHSFDVTEVNKNSTRPIPLDELDIKDE